MAAPEIDEKHKVRALVEAERRIVKWKTSSHSDLGLDLQNLGLTTFPPGLECLTNLSRLWLNGNLLTALPPEIGNLTSLEVLGVNDNYLTTVPPEIGHLTQLRTLGLDNNRLISLPETLAALPKLTQIYLHNNPGLGLPESILGPAESDVSRDSKKPGDPRSILTFYFERREKQVGPLNEIKVMLVGRGESGKTSIRRFFLSQPFDPQETETKGIALDTKGMTCCGRDVTMRLWDFAGQEITHALHQFFLTEGCVYVVVLDPRSDTMETDAVYWLEHIERYGCSAPVIVAMNKQDVSEYDVDRHALRKRFSNIRAFVPVSARTRVGCDTLLNKLEDVLSSMPQSEPPWLNVPIAWLIIKDECFAEGKKAKAGARRQHLTLPEFRELCAKHGEKNREKQEIVAKLLHNLGAVLHFVDDERLRDTAVLNPHWVTDGVYRLMRCKDGARSDGVISLRDAILALDKCDEADARFLLRLMEKFQMAYRLDEEDETATPNRWMVPGALTRFQPEDVGDEWDSGNSVRLRYTYESLPEGLIPRFIVLTHPLSHGQPRWRYGVVLVEGEGGLLLHRGLDTRKNTVFLTAIGPETDRLRLLQVAQGWLELIHRDLPQGGKPVAELYLAEAHEWRRVSDLAAAEDTDSGTLSIGTAAGARVEVKAEPVLNTISTEGSRDEERIPLRVFVSYSHDDEKALAVFKQNLIMMQNERIIDFWTDEVLQPSDEWRKHIDENLQRMDVFIGLASTAYFASRFIKRVEMRTGLERREKEGLLLIMVMLDDIAIEDTGISHIQFLKPGKRAIRQGRTLRDGFNAAHRDLSKQLRSLQIELAPKRDNVRTPLRDVP